MTHVIQVGDQDGALKFYPDTLEGVNAGDLVQFHFWPQVRSHLFTLLLPSVDISTRRIP